MEITRKLLDEIAYCLISDANDAPDSGMFSDMLSKAIAVENIGVVKFHHDGLKYSWEWFLCSDMVQAPSNIARRAEIKIEARERENNEWLAKHGEKHAS